MSRQQVVDLLYYNWSVDPFPNLSDPKWTVEKLEQEFDLDEKDASDLHLALGNNSRYTVYGLEDNKAVQFLNMVQEAIHQAGTAFEGYSPQDSFAIHMFLSDMAYCLDLEDQDNKKRSGK